MRRTRVATALASSWLRTCRAAWRRFHWQCLGRLGVAPCSWWDGHEPSPRSCPCRAESPRRDYGVAARRGGFTPSAIRWWARARGRPAARTRGMRRPLRRDCVGPFLGGLPPSCGATRAFVPAPRCGTRLRPRLGDYRSTTHITPSTRDVLEVRANPSVWAGWMSPPAFFHPGSSPFPLLVRRGDYRPRHRARLLGPRIGNGSARPCRMADRSHAAVGSVCRGAWSRVRRNRAVTSRY